ncbi:MAG: hypothetical protein C5B54_04810 [Acidobacteria bacterium]|nr:MAG: hypothetical protein C5B54_04810 [Acidobacteriota bacterium]
MMTYLVTILVLFLAIILGILYSRRQSITGIQKRNKHFIAIAEQLGFKQAGDEYFIHLEGLQEGVRVVIYPHNFEGPGSVTILYADTQVPFRERTWIEPALSMGRAIVDWQNQVPFGFEFSGDPILRREDLITMLEDYKKRYPFVAITLPSRYTFSQYVMDALNSWKNFVVILVLDSGRKPSLDSLKRAVDDAVLLVRTTTSN